MDNLILVSVPWTKKAFMTRVEFEAGWTLHTAMLRELGGKCDHGRLGYCYDCRGENGEIIGSN